MLDLGLDLLARGYGCQARMADDAVDGDPAIHPVRLLGKPAVLVAGREAVRFFYDRSRISRVGAVPAVLSDEIFGAGSVHGLDGPEHEARKRMHLDTLGPATTAEVTGLVQDRWDATIAEVTAGQSISLHRTLIQVLGATAQRWVGEPDRAERSQDLAAIVDGFGGAGPRQLRGRAARRRCEDWAADLIGRAGAGVPTDGPAAEVATANDAQGGPLAEHDAAVELLNLLRPLVAIAWLGSFIPLAFDERPEWRDRVLGGNEHDRVAFAHELRRHFPFVPMLAGRCRGEQTWSAHHLSDGERVILQVVATNHDPRLWADPWRFRPERFLESGPEAFSMVAQGGGDASAGHRCPGELVTIAVLAELAQSVAQLDYSATQPFSFPLRRMPTAPFGGPNLILRSP